VTLNSIPTPVATEVGTFTRQAILVEEFAEKIKTGVVEFTVTAEPVTTLVYDDGQYKPSACALVKPEK
jgi:hypothetical protein